MKTVRKHPRTKPFAYTPFQRLSSYHAASAKAVFFVTPPHLMPHASSILILIKQVTDSAMESAIRTARNQKPLYGTRYMLDELGNLQSDGQGIPKLVIMFIVSGFKAQQFTLILQTMQQILISAYASRR